MSGSIYKITCIPTGLCYIGQACDLKYKDGTPYNYGPKGRWNDHVSSSKKSKTPLANAIKQYGRDSFTIDTLEKAPLNNLDELEAKWIAEYNTIVPMGLNVAVHGRNKHHDTTTLPNYYKGKVNEAHIRSIKQNGEYRLVYLILHLNNETQQRITFGQNKEHSYDDALNEANVFAGQLECPIIYDTHNSEEFGERYSDKLKQFEGKTITKIRITTASQLIAVYVTTSEMKSHTEQVRICFGGKKISLDDAYKSALKFVDILNKPDNYTLFDSISKSRQQATA